MLIKDNRYKNSTVGIWALFLTIVHLKKDKGATIQQSLKNFT